VDQETQSDKSISSADETVLELIRKIAEGDKNALALLYDKTSRLLFGLILRILGNRTRAEEALLEVYTHIWKQCATYYSSTLPLEWLIITARSHAIARLLWEKKSRRERQLPMETANTAMTVAPEQQTLARSALQSLIPIQQEILNLAYCSGLSCSEIAAQIGRPIGAIRTHARIGLSKLGARIHSAVEPSVEETSPAPETHPDMRELAALFAIGALTQHEARSFEMHLHEGCPICEEELRKFEHAAAAIGFACEERETPEYVRDLLLARIEREPQAFASIRTENKLKEASSEKGPHLQSKINGLRVLPWAIAVICALLGMFAFYSWKPLQNANHRLREQQSVARIEILSLKKQLEVQQNTPAEPTQIEEMAVQQGIRIARLNGQPATPEDSGTLFWDTQKGQCLFAGAFAPLSQGKTYQLWLSTSKAKILIGSLPADANGRIYATLPAPPNIDGVIGVIVTLESEPASQSPAGPYCATGRID
jgi:RNA polymerase sigma-70 factor (ECF subfamily)